MSLTPYWVRFIEGDPRCIEAQNIEGVYPQAAAHGKVATVKPLPMRWCQEPDKCQGRTSCQRKLACSE